MPVTWCTDTRVQTKDARGLLAAARPKRERSTLKPGLDACPRACVWDERRFPLVTNPDLSAEDERFSNNHMPVDSN